jgi:hypothetical protein
MKALVIAHVLGVAAVGAEPIPMPGLKEPSAPSGYTRTGSWERSVAGYAEGSVFYYSLGHLVGRTPAWERGDEHPPLAARKAEEIATKELSKLLTAPGAWSCSAITLERSPLKDRWYYIVKFENQHDSTSRGVGMRVVVLMDGTVPKTTKHDFPTEMPNKSRLDNPLPRPESEVESP